MPPKKRIRVSQATSHTSSTPELSKPTPPPAATPGVPPQPTSPSTSAAPSTSLDAWTDEEEIGLFKGLIRWKPTGIHKHFRLLALHQFMASNGYIHPRAEHTRPVGIWRKLQTIYDLEALDEREDARQLSELSMESGNDEEEEQDDVYSMAGNKIHREDFGLPDEEFGELKWRQRLASDKEDSPPELPEVNMAEEAPVRFTPSFSVEPSELLTPSVRGGRSRAGTGRGRGRGGAGTAATRRSMRQAESVAESVGDDQRSETASKAEEQGESEDAEDAESEQSTPARTTRTGRGRGRGGAARGRGRGRGRGK